LMRRCRRTSKRRNRSRRDSEINLMWPPSISRVDGALFQAERADADAIAELRRASISRPTIARGALAARPPLPPRWPRWRCDQTN
jgi:hypothetical protein